MPATCTFLVHQLSPLLLVGLHLFVGSFPLDSLSSSSSSSSSTGSPQVTTVEPPRSAAPTPEESSFAAASFLPPLERKNLEPSAASSGVWVPATGGRSSNPGIMSSQKAAESLHTESRTFSSATDDADAFSIFNNDEGRTLRLITDYVSVSTAAIGRASSYPETVQSVDLSQDSSSVMQTRRADAPSNTLHIAELETVPLMTHLPHTPVSLLSEHNFSATGSIHHRDSSWDVESTTSSLHNESMDSSALTVNTEKTSQFLADSVTLTDSATKDPASQMELTVSSDRTQFSSQATQSRGSTTSNIIQFPDSLARIVLTHSYLSPNTAAEGGDQRRSNSSTEQSIFSSQTDSISVLGVSNTNGGRILQTLTDISHSHNATQTFISSSNEISSSLSHTYSSYVLTPEQTSGLNLSLGDTEFTETALVHSHTHSETTAAEGGDRRRSNSSTEQTIFSSQTDSMSVLGVSNTNGGRILQTLTDISRSHNATQTFISSNNEISSSLSHTHSSYVLTPEQTSGLNLSLGDTELTETALVHSHTHSETTAAEGGDRQRSNSSTEQRIFSSQTDSMSVLGVSNTNGGRILQTLTDISHSHNATQTFISSSNEISSSLSHTHSSYVLTPEQTSGLNLSLGDTELTETALVHSHTHSETTAAEGGDRRRSNSSTEQTIFSSQTDSMSVLGVSNTNGGRILQTLTDISHSHNATQTFISSSNEISSSLSHTHSSYVLTPEQTSGLNLSLGDTEFTETALVHSHTHSETTDDRNIQHTAEGEKRDTHTQTDSTVSSAAVFSDTVGTLKAVTKRSKPTETTEISAFGLEDVTSSDLIQTSSLAVESRRNQVLSTEKDITETSEEPLLTHSPQTSFYLPSTIDLSNVKTKQHTFSTYTGKRGSQTESTFSSIASIRDGNGTLDSLTNSNKLTEATSLSNLGLEGVSSSVLTQYSSVTVEIGKNPSSSEETHFTETSEEPLLRYSPKTSIYSPSTIDLSSSGKSHQPVNVSDPQGRISSASTDSLYLSTTFMHGAERTLRSLPDNSTSDEAESNISNTEASSSSNPTLTLTSVTEAKEHNVSLSEGQFTEHSTEHLFEHSSLVPIHSSSSEDSSTVGSGPHRASSSGTEMRALHSYTDTMYSSAPFSSGEEQTLQSVMNTTFTEVTASSSSYIEKSSASELNHSLSGMYSEMTDFSGKDLDISGPSTETVQSFTSSRIPTYSSFESEPSDTGYNFQTVDSTDTGKRSSPSHTDSTYISTPFTKGGERTLLSISNNSTSFYAEISTPSESAQSTLSVTQNIGSNLSSSDRDFSAPSTEPLAVQTLQTAGYSSTVGYSVSDSTSSSSLSFLSSSQASSLQSSLPPTQPPPLFSSSESSWPASSSASPTQLSSQTPSLTPSPKLSSTALPTFPPFSFTLPAPASTSSLLQPSINLETSVSEPEPEGTTGIDLSTAGSSTHEYNNQPRTYPLNTDFSSPGSSPLQTETTEQLTNHSTPITISLGKTKSSQEQNVSLPGTSAEKSVPNLTISPTYLSESTTVYGTAKVSSSVLPKTTQKDIFSLVEVTTGNSLTNVTHTMLGLPPLASATDYSITVKSPKVQSPTEMPYTSGTTTKGMEMSSAPTVKVIEHQLSTTHPPTTFSSSKPTTRPFSTLPVPTKPTTAAWLGSPNAFTTSHGKDIDKCLSNPCPALATCTNTQGSFQCICSLGYRMEKGKCNLARTFVGQFPLMFNTTGGKYSELHQIEEDIINTLNNSLSTLPGYYTSTVQASRQSGTIQVSITSTFSVVSNVTLYDIVSTVRSHIRACKASSETCQFMSSLLQLHRAGGLCKHKDPECDKETSVCVDFDGIADCQCKPGYFRYNKLDHSCRACEDGYKLENDTCVSCPFGLGGFNCGNPYQLITIVIAAAGGGLLLILGIALIVTCCQKNKNDISKLIFKSGDFQMSPYAEYPKNPRAQDWGRETIEMQENGSTKNLLQMTDVYYMPTNIRNPELERNGLYPPYTGLPGTRHSCIYPGQYNPSFVSDDSRRRDYF